MRVELCHREPLLCRRDFFGLDDFLRPLRLRSVGLALLFDRDGLLLGLSRLGDRCLHLLSLDLVFGRVAAELLAGGLQACGDLADLLGRDRHDVRGRDACDPGRLQRPD